MPSRKADEVKIEIPIMQNDVEEQDCQPRSSRDARNKYERAIVSAMEARRLNDITRVTGESLSARVTQMAIENVRAGKVTFFYEEATKPPGETAEE